MRENRWESKLDPGSLYQVIYFLSSICSVLHLHPHPLLSGTSLFPLIAVAGPQGLLFPFLQSVIMKKVGSWREGLLLIIMEKQTGCWTSFPVLTCPQSSVRGGQVYGNLGHEGSFVDKVNRTQVIVLWKY